VVRGPELDGVTIGLKSRRVAGGRAPDEVKRPGDDEKRHGRRQHDERLPRAALDPHDLEYGAGMRLGGGRFERLFSG
jgi:hypothetical protein